MSDQRVTWSEEASGTYQRIAAIAVPYRAEQIAALLMLLPFDVNESFHAVELGSGEGRLAGALLEAFPRATVTGLDGSEAMRETSRHRLAKHGNRFRVSSFNLLDDAWWPELDGAQAVLSSLVVHHLDGAGKQTLFREVRQRCATPATLLIADLVLPAHPRAQTLYANLYDRAARARSQELVGSDAYFQAFVDEEWNFFRYPDEDDWDKPSGLHEQLRWLTAVGYPIADCFWLQAGHAIYGGYTDAAAPNNGLTWERAMEIATAAAELTDAEATD